MERMLQAVDIWGGTRTSFVLGIEMAPPYGFKTEEEAAESVIKGFEWCVAHKVTPNAVPWRPAPGTEFAGVPSPRTEYFLRMELIRHKMALGHNLPRKHCSHCGGPSISRDWAHVDSPGKN